MGWFYVATSDASGNRITGSEVLLQPGPTKVGYPQEPAGELIETDDGSVIHQQPNKDGRMRQWTWDGYPAIQAGYQRLYPLLESLRSRYRYEAGLCPYVYLKESGTDCLRKRSSVTGVSGSGSAFTFTDGSASWSANAFVGGFVIVNGQARAILGNTSTTLSVGDGFLSGASGAYVISYWTPDWFRARVLEVSRAPNADGKTLRYTESRMSFVVDDPNDSGLLG
jgi:hypothetical protein